PSVQKEPGSKAGFRSLHTKPPLVGLAGPGAPATTGVDEVAVRRLGLRARARAVSVQVPRGRAHLEQAEILAVLGGRAQTRLAARDGERLVAVRAEDSADRDLWRVRH